MSVRSPKYQGTPSGGQTLLYNASTGFWEPGSASGAQAASVSAQGIVELSTDAENQAGTAGILVVTAAGLKAELDRRATGYVGTSDSRLTNARTPTAHKTTHATGGTDALTPSDIGARVAGNVPWGEVSGKPTTYPPDSHTHDDRYFTETESDGRFIRTVNSTGPDANGNVTVSGGGGSGATDHGALTGLGDDDHTIYYNQTRGDARYRQLSQNVPWAEVSGKPSVYPPDIGSGAAQAVAGNDARLTNARTPTAHSHTATDLPASSETGSGVAELATASEVQTGTDTVRIVTPAGLSSRTATGLRTGLAMLAGSSEVQAGTDGSKIVTPAGLKELIKARVCVGTLASGNTLITGSASNNWTKVPLNTLARHANMSSAFSTSNGRITPDFSGEYRVDASAFFSSNTANQTYRAALYKNGSFLTEIGAVIPPANRVISAGGPYAVYFNGTTDYIELFVTTSNTSDATVTAQTYLSVSFVGLP